MLVEILDNLKKTVPSAFIDKPTRIPWVSNDSQVIKIEEVFAVNKESANEESNIPPTIFVDPNTKVLAHDEELNTDIQGKGTEALAWYVSFHQSFKNWGIYIRIRGLSYLSNLFDSKDSIDDVNKRLKLAFDLLLYHEFFHFLTDMVSANMEMIYKKPVYNSYFDISDKLTTKGMNIEEPLANVYLLKKLPKRFHRHIKNFFRIQPAPYNHFDKYESDIAFVKGKRKLGAMLHAQLGESEESKNAFLFLIILEDSVGKFPNVDEPFWEFMFNAEPEKLFISQIPIYLVSERHPNGIFKFITPIMTNVKVAAYPGDHPPPHLHIWMPADSKNSGRYLYPSLEPYLGAKPLGGKKKKVVESIIKKHSLQIERELKKIGEK